jgi:hypothetical protein
MKIRNGFVSNSSSSSFVIHDVDVTFEQRLLIEYACQLMITGWTYERTYGSIIGYTDMDNFDMGEYMEKIGVPSDKIRWAEFRCTSYLDGDMDTEEVWENWESIENRVERKATEILKTLGYNSVSEGKDCEN